jgi:hypothetical protein
MKGHKIKKQTVDSVQNTAMGRKNSAEIFDIEVTFNCAKCQSPICPIGGKMIEAMMINDQSNLLVK